VRFDEVGADGQIAQQALDNAGSRDAAPSAATDGRATQTADNASSAPAPQAPRSAETNGHANASDEPSAALHGNGNSNGNGDGDGETGADRQVTEPDDAASTDDASTDNASSQDDDATGEPAPSSARQRLAAMWQQPVTADADDHA
jgi:hypothetical protein